MSTIKHKQIKGYDTIINKTNSLKTECHALQVQVDSKRLNEKLGMHTKVGQLDSEILLLKGELEDYENKIKMITTKNTELYDNSVGEYDTIKSRLSQQLVVSNELKKRSSEITNYVRQESKKVCNKELEITK